MKSRKIELLAPARDIECGIAAIDHGADAVYIGAAKFGARSVASNSIEDINKLTNYAHQFDSRVYLALNTILYDNEIDDAVQLAWDGYHAGIDALIIQDMGLLECNLPPIPLHASTQTNNRTAEKVVFLEEVGFSQIVLARELSLEKINEISRISSVTLEFFIHGALCTSYSGQCYMSCYATNRSGNRGECSQMCRHKYSLYNSDGNLVVKDKYLLSLKDLNLTDNIEALIDAGISSFKIEGRLKGPEYVRNITAHYRKIIDEIISKRADLETSSSGKCSINFEPKPEKTFNRFFTSYFVSDSGLKIANFNSPKSVGEKIGVVIDSGSNWIKIDTHQTLSNGDGLCYFDQVGELFGFRVNKVEEGKIFPVPYFEIEKETILYRNKDVQFEDILNKSKPCRKIRVRMELWETENGISLRVIDEKGIQSETKKEIDKQQAKDPEKQFTLIHQQLGKLGDTIFNAEKITVAFSNPLFIPSKTIGEIRREALSALLQNRLTLYKRIEQSFKPNSYPYIQTNASYEENISNSKAEKFYKRHGVENIEKAYELQARKPNQLLMTTKYCIRKELDICLIKDIRLTQQKNNPLFIEDNTGKYLLEFDCKKCEMKIYST